MKKTSLTANKNIGRRHSPAFRILFFALMIIFALPAFFGCTAANASAPIEKLSDALRKEGTLPHDANAFTEGLFFHKGKLYESTGLKNYSEIHADINLNTGKAASSIKLPDNAFGEGSCIMDDNLYVLTYTEGKVFVFDPQSLTLKRTIDGYPREGWGLTTDGKQLYAGDGSSHLYLLDENTKTTRTINITDGGKPVENINELEWIDGKIWANIWQSSDIVIINPENGKVEHRIDCSELKDSAPHENTDDVLNGIAYDKTTGKIYLTGKRWQTMFVFSPRD